MKVLYDSEFLDWPPSFLNLSSKTFLIVETEDLWELDFAASHAGTRSANSPVRDASEGLPKEIAP